MNRSQQMSRIRGRDTGPELMLRRALWRKGLRYRVAYRTPAGRPDVVFLSRRVAIFIDGCFWHGCPLHYSRPFSSASYWGAKLKRNVGRDRRQTLLLVEQGWEVVRIWEHELVADMQAVILKVRRALLGEKHVRDDWRAIEVLPLPGRGRRERWTLENLCNETEHRFLVRDRCRHGWPRAPEAVVRQVKETCNTKVTHA